MTAAPNPAPPVEAAALNAASPDLRPDPLEARVAELELEVGNLRQALQTNRTIGVAIGIVMERWGLSHTSALLYLTRVSQQTNTKLRVLAERLAAGNSP